jgi:hypothetical protein
MLIVFAGEFERFDAPVTRTVLSKSIALYLGFQTEAITVSLTAGSIVAIVVIPGLVSREQLMLLEATLKANNVNPFVGFPVLDVSRLDNQLLTTAAGCVDLLPDCAYLAAAGRCNVHRSFMQVYCRATCNGCPSSAKDDPEAECADAFPPVCPALARLGKCQDSPLSSWMEANCRLSCNQCRLTICEDLDPKCPTRALNGECLGTDSSQILELCPISCSSCNVCSDRMLVSAWESWGPCSASCGGGVKSRTRQVSKELKCERSHVVSCMMQSCTQVATGHKPAQFITGSSRCPCIDPALYNSPALSSNAYGCLGDACLPLLYAPYPTLWH